MRRTFPHRMAAGEVYDQRLQVTRRHGFDRAHTNFRAPRRTSSAELGAQIIHHGAEPRRDCQSGSPPESAVRRARGAGAASLQGLFRFPDAADDVGCSGVDRCRPGVRLPARTASGNTSRSGGRSEHP